MEYLGITPRKVKIAVFEFTGCAGCELQLLNKEETLTDFLDAVEIVRFREASSAVSDDYLAAFVEGSISREDEIKRLEKIRSHAKILIAIGSCACFGGVNQMKNAVDISLANREVYGKFPKLSLPARPLKDFVRVDLEIPGCPISKSEIESVIKHMMWRVMFKFPVYPVCVECKQRFNTCLFERAQLCLGPVTMGGCGAPCPTGGMGCWGCRGPAIDPNYDSFFSLAEERGFSRDEIEEMMNFFGGFTGVTLK